MIEICKVSSGLSLRLSLLRVGGKPLGVVYQFQNKRFFYYLHSLEFYIVLRRSIISRGPRGSLDHIQDTTLATIYTKSKPDKDFDGRTSPIPNQTAL